MRAIIILLLIASNSVFAQYVCEENGRTFKAQLTNGSRWPGQGSVIECQNRDGRFRVHRDTVTGLTTFEHIGQARPQFERVKMHHDIAPRRQERFPPIQAGRRHDGAQKGRGVIRMHKDGMHHYLDLTVGGVPIRRALVDTGASLLSLPDRVINRVRGKQFVKQVMITTANGQAAAKIYKVTVVEIQGHRFKNVLVSSIPGASDALVGGSILNRLKKLNMDMAGSKLVFDGVIPNHQQTYSAAVVDFSEQYSNGWEY